MRNKTRPSILAIIHGHQSRPSIPAIIHGHRRHYHQPRLSYTAIVLTTAATRNTLQFNKNYRHIDRKRLACRSYFCDGSIFTHMQVSVIIM